MPPATWDCPGGRFPTELRRRDCGSRCADRSRWLCGWRGWSYCRRRSGHPPVVVCVGDVQGVRSALYGLHHRSGRSAGRMGRVQSHVHGCYLHRRRNARARHHNNRVRPVSREHHTDTVSTVSLNGDATATSVVAHDPCHRSSGSGGGVVVLGYHEHHPVGLEHRAVPERDVCGARISHRLEPCGAPNTGKCVELCSSGQLLQWERGHKPYRAMLGSSLSRECRCVCTGLPLRECPFIREIHGSELSLFSAGRRRRGSHLCVYGRASSVTEVMGSQSVPIDRISAEDCSLQNNLF